VGSVHSPALHELQICRDERVVTDVAAG